MNNRNLSFQDQWEVNNPPAPYTPGSMTQDAADSLLHIMKQPTPPELVEAEPTTRSTRSKRPARQYNNNNNNNNNNNKKSSRHQTKNKTKQKQKMKKKRKRKRRRRTKQAAKPEEQDKEEEEDEEIDAKAADNKYCKMIYHDPNHFNTFGEDGDRFTNAELNTEAYAKKVVRNHDRFIQIVADATDPAKNDPGDAVLHEMFTKKIIFYYRASGAKSLQSKTLVDQAMKIWTTTINYLVSGDPLNFKSHHTYSRQLFSAFHLRGVPYNEGEFKHKGGYKAVDPTLGTKRTKAEFDELVDEKFKKVINDGTYKPYEDMLDLLKLMAMELGGFDTSHQLSLNNAEVSTNDPMVVEDTDNPNCIVKLIFYYRDHCSPDQVRFFCHVNHLRHKTSKCVFKAKSPVEADTIRKWVRDLTEVADFKDWEKTQRLRRQSKGFFVQAFIKNSNQKKTEVDNSNSNSNSNSNNNKPSAARITNEVIIDVDQQDKENIPVPRDPAPAAVLGTKKTSPSKDTLKKEELKKEDKKQRTKLQDAEDNIAQLTINLKASNNINKTLTNEANRLH
eukprot:jgi/Psemu1/31810/gm1.31810_g